MMPEKNESLLELLNREATLCSFDAQFTNLGVDTVNALNNISHTWNDCNILSLLSEFNELSKLMSNYID